MARAITRVPGLWAPFDLDTHTWEDKSGERTPCTFDYFMPYEWTDAEGQTTVFVYHVHSGRRLRAWHLTLLLALSRLSKDATWDAHPLFGRLGSVTLPRPSFVNERVVEAPAPGLSTRDALADAGWNPIVGCPPELLLDCTLEGLTLTSIAKLMYPSDRDAYRESKLQDLRNGLSYLSSTVVNIFHVQNPQMAQGMVNGQWFADVKEEATRKKISVQYLTLQYLEAWQGDVKLVVSVPLIRNMRTQRVTGIHKCVDRIYTVKINPLLAMSMAYGRSTPDVLAQANSVTLPGVYQGFVHSYKHDLDMRLRIGVRSERLLALYTFMEQRGPQDLVQPYKLTDVMKEVYGHDLPRKLGTASANGEQRASALEKLRKMKSRVKSDVLALRELLMTEDSGKQIQQFNAVFGALLR